MHEFPGTQCIIVIKMKSRIAFHPPPKKTRLSARWKRRQKQYGSIIRSADTLLQDPYRDKATNEKGPKKTNL